MGKVTALIMAGGQGARFWPVSRAGRPKQFLKLGGSDKSLIRATADRIAPLTGENNVFVITNDKLKGLVHEHVPSAQVICEPAGRNTAAAIGLGALYCRRVDPEAVMIVLPADHAVKDEVKLREAWSKAVTLAEKNEALVTIGIKPTCPNTAYGYIRKGGVINGSTGAARSYKVKRFYEKPSFERAVRYLESGEYLWNSGMFVWKAAVILKAIEEHMPALAGGLSRIDDAVGTASEQAVLKEVFENLESVSIDFGVLELAQNCLLVEAEPFGWNDVGSWDAWAEHFEVDGEGNLLSGDVTAIDSRNCIVHTDAEDGRGRLTAILGLENVVVIDSGDAVLICARDRVQDVRKIVDSLKERKRFELI